MTDVQLFKLKLLLTLPTPPDNWQEILVELVEIAERRVRRQAKFKALQGQIESQAEQIKDLHKEVADLNRKLALPPCTACQGTGREPRS